MKNPIDRTPGYVGYKNARVSLLLIIIFSVVNLFSTVLAETYFLFSAYIPQLLISVGYYLSAETGLQLYTLVGGVMGFILIVPYFICWIFSKKHVGWMIGALAFFAVYSVIFLIDFIGLLAMGDYSMLIDLFIRVCALTSLILGVVYGFRAKRESIVSTIEISSVPGSQSYEQPSYTNSPYGNSDTHNPSV